MKFFKKIVFGAALLGLMAGGTAEAANKIVMDGSTPLVR